MNKSISCLFSLLLLLAFSAQLKCQSSDQKIDFKKPNPELLEELIIRKINEYRSGINLDNLQMDSILQKAAKNQAKYNYKANRISNTQDNKRMATPFLRVNQFDGNHSLVEETDSYIQMGEKTKIKGIRGRTILHSYEEAANAITTEWISSKSNVKLIENEDYYSIGAGVVFVPGENVIFATVVYGSEPYIKHKEINYTSNSYRISPNSLEACKYFNREFGYLPELFSSSLNIQDGKIYFYFHDLFLIKSILKSRKDGLAVDIVERNQFNCGSGNREHPAKVERGILLKPVKKGRLLRRNPLKESNEFRAYLGDYPSSLDTNNTELNLLILQNMCNCETVYFNNLNSENLHLLEVDFAIDTISITEDIDSLSRQINFTIPFEKNKAEYQVEDIKPILDSIQLNRYDIKQINITAYSSIEGNAASNEILQQKRAESILLAIQQYQLQTVKTSITTMENWDGFKKSIENSPYFQNFKSLSNDEMRSIVNSDTLKFNLEPYLESQRKADINIVVESIYIDSLIPELLPEKFMKGIANNEPIVARGIQTLMLSNVEKGIMKKEALFPEEEIPFLKENMPIMNNIMAFKLKYYQGDNLDSLFEDLKSEASRYFGIDPANAHLNYNKQLIELYYWSRNIHYLMVDKEANIDQPRDLYKAIRKLYNTKIDNWKINQLLLNYHLIAADFYYETKDFKLREKSLKAVKKLILKSNLNQEQTYIMAGYFMFQIHMDWAIEIMQPFIEKDDYNEDFLFRLISISVYDKDAVPDEKFIKYLKLAKEMNENRYCQLFGAPNMSFQLLSNRKIKEAYCNTCNTN